MTERKVTAHTGELHPLPHHLFAILQAAREKAVEELGEEMVLAQQAVDMDLLLYGTVRPDTQEQFNQGILAMIKHQKIRALRQDSLTKQIQEEHWTS